MYIKKDVKLSKSQIQKIRRGIKADESVRIRLDNKGDVSTYLMLTQTDINKLENNNKSNQIHLSKTQLQSNKHLLSSKSKKKSVEQKSTTVEQKSTTVEQKSTKSTQSDKTSTKDSDITKLIDDYIRNLKVKELEELIIQINEIVKLKQEDFTGAGIGNLFKLAIPFAKKVLPKILGTLGLAAASGAISGATHKTTSGMSINSKDLRIIDDLYHEMGKTDGYEGKSIYNEQSGGFIGTLLATLAGTLLPSPLGGKGVSHPTHSAKGIARAGSKPKGSGKGVVKNYPTHSARGIARAGSKVLKKKV